MSILRGINHHHQQKRCPSTAETYNTQPNALTTPPNTHNIQQELKTLMKENTKIKQENLQLKQQLMFFKIQLQNSKMKHQVIINDMQQQLQSAFQIINKQLATKYQHTESKERPKYVEISPNYTEIETIDFNSLPMQIPRKIQSHRQQDGHQFNSWKSKTSSLNYGIGARNLGISKELSCIGRQSDMLSRNSKETWKGASRKEQILRKYRCLQDNLKSQSSYNCSASQSFQ